MVAAQRWVRVHGSVGAAVVRQLPGLQQRLHEGAAAIHAVAESVAGVGVDGIVVVHRVGVVLQLLDAIASPHRRLHHSIEGVGGEEGGLLQRLVIQRVLVQQQLTGLERGKGTVWLSVKH